jgi:hypothetical protein
MLDGCALDPRVLKASGWQTLAWDVPAGAAGTVKVRLVAEPGFESPGDRRRLGVAVESFGFR